MASRDPTERKYVSSLGGLARSAREDPKAITAPARAAFDQGFIDEAWEGITPYAEQLVRDHPDHPDSMLLPMLEQEVVRRAAALRKAHFRRLGLASVKARQQKGRVCATRPSAMSGEHPIPEASSEVNDTSTPEGDS